MWQTNNDARHDRVFAPWKPPLPGPSFYGHRWISPGGAGMHEYTMGALLERACRSYGPRVAVVDGDRRITYSELISTVRKTGRALLATGLRPGDRVALLMPDRPELLYAYYGALWAGLAAVPLNARLGAEDQEYILADSGAKAVVHDRAYAGRLADILGNTSIEHRLGVDEDAI